MKQVLIVVAAFVLMGCSKSEQLNSTVCSGVVINGITGELFRTGEVDIIETETPARPFEAIVEKEIANQSIASSGEFEFDFNAKRGNRYSYRVKYSYPNWTQFASAGYEGTEVVDEAEIKKKGSNTNVTLKVYPTGGLKVKVSNLQPYDEDDLIEVYAEHDLAMAKLVHYKGRGDYSNEQFIKLLAGDQLLRWDVTKNGQTESMSQLISVVQGENETISIDY